MSDDKSLPGRRHERAGRVACFGPRFLWHARYVTNREEPKLLEDLVEDAIDALVPVGGAVGRRLVRAVATEWRRNRSVALRAAVVSSGLSREDFAEWVSQDSRAVPLFQKILWAAAMNGHDETLRSMGVVLGRAAQAGAAEDEDEFETAELALRAMDEMTPRHFRVLAAVDAAEPIPREDDEDLLTAFTPTNLAAASGTTVRIATQCLINLTGAGLVTTRQLWEDTAYLATDLGVAIVRATELRQDV